jgi:hypothetical protein
VIFKVEGKALVLRITLPNNSKDVIIAGDRGIERLAQNNDPFEYFRDLVTKKAAQEGKDGFVKRVERLAGWVERDAERRGWPSQDRSIELMPSVTSI